MLQANAGFAGVGRYAVCYTPAPGRLEGQKQVKAPSITKSLPVVKGLVFDQFTLGEVIQTENPEALDVVVRIAQAMTKYEMLDMVVELDVSDTSNIKAYVNKVEVNLGTISDYDTKVRTMCEIVKQIPENDRGSLDLSDLSKPIVFKYLT